MSLALVLTVEMVRAGWRMAKKSIFVTFRVVERFMGRHPISELIFVGIQGKDRLFAIGCSVTSDLRDLTNFSGTDEPTQGKRNLLANNVENGSCEAITCLSM